MKKFGAKSCVKNTCKTKEVHQGRLNHKIQPFFLTGEKKMRGGKRNHLAV
jgi:hypothetical protein